jgi:predicted DNA binding CopG/RHH family protein
LEVNLNNIEIIKKLDKKEKDKIINEARKKRLLELEKNKDSEKFYLEYQKKRNQILSKKN